MATTSGFDTRTPRRAAGQHENPASFRESHVQPPRLHAIVLGAAFLAASHLGSGHAQTTFGRPDFAVPLFEELAADTVLTAVGTIPHQPDHVRWIDRTDDVPWCEPGLIRGVTTRDLDGDGRIDLFFARAVTWPRRLGEDSTDRTLDGQRLPPSQLWWNEGGGRWRRHPRAPWDESIVHHTWRDLDRDGDADLVVLVNSVWSPRDAQLGSILIWRQDVARRFEEVVLAPDAFEAVQDAAGFAVLDADRDGHLDVMFVSRAPGADVRGVRIACLRGPHFELELVRREPLPSLQAHEERLIADVQDVDGDGHREFVLIDGAPYWDRVGTAIAVHHDAGQWSVRPIEGPRAGPAFYGVTRADVDGDGRADLFQGQSDYFGGRNVLLLQRADGGFDRTDERTGLFAGYAYTGGMVFADFDHDGRLDGLQPRWAAATRSIPSELFRQLEPDADTPRFGALRGAAVPDLVGASPAAVWFDADADGDLDLLFGRTLHYAESAPYAITRDRFFENVSRTGSWLQVDLESPRGRHGARVSVVVGEQRFVRWCGEGGVLNASELPWRVHFGLGDAEGYDRIEVQWPSGRTEVWPGGVVDRRIRLIEDTGVAP